MLVKPPAEIAQIKARPGRALALRGQLSAYDAIYVAMAEVTGATLLTATPAWPGPPGTGPGWSWSRDRAQSAKPLPRATARRSRALSRTSAATPWSRATSRRERPVAAASLEMAAASS